MKTYVQQYNRVSGRSRLRRANSSRPCPVCGGQGCGSAGKLVLCWRTGSERQARSGASIHILDDGFESAPFQPRITPRASIKQRDLVYSAIVQSLPLSGFHADQLFERGISDTTIERCQFATVPGWRDGDALAAEIAKYTSLRGVPGFWKKDDRWVMSFAGCRGFFIPIRNIHGQIEALQIRRDGDDGAKYMLFSSSDRTGGASSGAPAHFTRVSPDTESVIITEGALKAEVIAEYLDCPVIGLVSVGSFADTFGGELRQTLPKLREAVVAYDSDWRTNEKVAMQLIRLCKVLRRAGFCVRVAVWDGAKGLDDYLKGVAE